MYARRFRINHRDDAQTDYDSNIVLPCGLVGVVRSPQACWHEMDSYELSEHVHVQVLLVPCIVTIRMSSPDESSRTGNAASASEYTDGSVDNPRSCSEAKVATCCVRSRYTLPSPNLWK